MDSTNLTVTFKNRKMKEEHTHEKKINHFSLFYIIYIYIHDTKSFKNSGNVTSRMMRITCTKTGKDI
jgi:hypothetical protein